MLREEITCWEKVKIMLTLMSNSVIFLVIKMTILDVIKKSVKSFSFNTGKLWKASSGESKKLNNDDPKAGEKRNAPDVTTEIKQDENREVHTETKVNTVNGIATRGGIKQGIPLVQWKSIPGLRDHINESDEKSEQKQLYFRDGGEKTRMQHKAEKDLQLFKSRFKIDPYIPKLDEEYFEGQLVDMINNDRYHIVEEKAPEDSFRRQRSAYWYQNRKGKITGSKTTSVVASFGLKQLQMCYYETYDDKNPTLQILKNEENEEQKAKSAELMHYGSVMEIHGHATILKHLGEKWNIDIHECILSPIYPADYFIQAVRKSFLDLFNRQCGSDDELRKWIVAAFGDSPDGLGQFRDTGSFFLIELKTPLGLRLPLPYDKVKYYYYIQMQLHMKTLPVEHQTPDLFCLFGSWTPTISKFWKVKYDPLFWKLAMPLFVRFLDNGLNKKQCPQTIEDQELVDFIDIYVKDASERNSEYVGEFLSAFSSKWEDEVKEAKKQIWLAKQTPEMQTWFKQREAEEAIKAAEEEAKAAKK